MLLCFISCISFFLFLNSVPLKSIPPWGSEMRLVNWFWNDFSLLKIWKLVKNILSGVYLCPILLKMPLNKKPLTSKVEIVEDKGEVSVMDLPELVLECILERLPADSLVNMAGVCRFFREKSKSDHLWRKRMQQKWGRVIGQAAYREWQWHIASKKNLGNLKSKQKRLTRNLSFGRYFSWIRSKVNDNCNRRSSFPVDSIMSWYLALENGRFWFPAQVYNREHGHEGFVMSCYDAELCYDPSIDAFQARYPPHGRRRAAAIENGVQWERLRQPIVDTPPHDLHISGCLNDLRPGDHIEIQWRRNKEFPHGWWYGVVGHLETCNGNANYCLCHNSETVVLEFNQYAPGSGWRRTTINRQTHREEGNEACGFYGGIVKLENEEQISKWKCLWPTQEL